MPRVPNNLPMAKWRTRRSGCWTLACVLGLAWSSAIAQDQAPSQPQKPTTKTSPAERSLDDALLDDLDNELLEGLGDMKDLPPPEPQRKQLPGETDADKPEGEMPEPQPLDPHDGEDPGAAGADDDPLGYISQEMRLVEELISKQGKRDYTESMQQRIVEDLAHLIEQAERQQAQQQSSSSSQQQQQQQQARRQSIKQPEQSQAQAPGKTSQKPAADSTDRLGRAERARPDPELFQGLLKDSWGNLPQREREQMMQMSPERFLPQYELMIERYYRRLSEEKSN